MITLDPPRNGKHPGPTSSALPPAASAFTPSMVTLARRMRFNPLRMVTPENLATAHDNFDVGYLWQAALYWDAMIRRDDTLAFVVPQLQNSIAQKPWGVWKKKGADEQEAARHAAALEYFYANVTAVDAFDRNIRGDRHLLLKQMGLAYAMRYAVHHFCWKPSGKMIEVEGAAPVPALTAEMEFVPLWFFENTSGTLRLLRQGGFGGIGEDIDWDGEWMVTSGDGAMFAAAGCYIFKRLTFQDWTIYNERYGQQKVIGMTTAQADSEAGRALTGIVENFAGDMGIALHECQNTETPPISLLGPTGTASVDVFERFLQRQDEKLNVLFRGSAQANAAAEKKDTGITAQIKETEALEIAHCANIASACRTFIDRMVIKYCFGEGVEPLAYFGLPDMDDEDAAQLMESAGFMADRLPPDGPKVDAINIADRLGVPLTEVEEDALQPATKAADPNAPDPVLKRQIDYDQYKRGAAKQTANSIARLEELVEEALRTANTDDSDIERWITVQGRHIPIRKGQSAEQAIEEHGHFEKHATRGEKNRRQNAGMKWHAAERKTSEKTSEKASPKASPKAGEQSKIKEPNEPVARHHSDRQSAPRGTDTVAGKTIGTELARVEGSGSAAGTDLSGRLQNQEDALYEIHQRNSKLRFEPNPAKHIATGGEHIVEHFGNDRVLKHTKGYGFTVEVDPSGKARLRDALPSEYLTRLDANHAVFGDDTRVEGVTAVDRNLGLAVSQMTLTKAADLSVPEIEGHMRSLGYQKVGTDAFSGKHISDKTWFKPATGYMVSDVKPDNFIKTADGEIHPIDVMTQHLAPEHPMHALFKQHLEK